MRINDTGGNWGSHTDGFANTNKGYVYQQGIDHCRGKFGARAFIPAKDEIPARKPANVDVKFDIDYYFIYATSTVAHFPGKWWQAWYVISGEKTQREVKLYHSLLHRCFYKQNP